MGVKSYDRGYRTKLIDGIWYYIDTGLPVDEVRECVRCGKIPTPEGYDACLGYIEGVTSACCGHGVSEPINV